MGGPDPPAVARHIPQLHLEVLSTGGGSRRAREVDAKVLVSQARETGAAGCRGGAFLLSYGFLVLLCSGSRALSIALSDGELPLCAGYMLLHDARSDPEAIIRCVRRQLTSA